MLEILAFLDNRHDIQTITNCSLVSRTWLSCSRSKLFHTIVLDRKKRWTQFKVLLCSSTPSHIAHYIKTVRNLIVLPVYGEDSWSHEVLVACSQYLTGLKSIELDSCTWTSEWRSSLPRIAPYSSVQALKIARVEVGDFGDLYRILSVFPALSQLTLDGYTEDWASPEVSMTHEEQQNMAKLHSLTDLVMYDSELSLAWWLPHIGFTRNLKRLDWAGEYDPEKQGWDDLTNAINGSSLLSMCCQVYREPHTCVISI